MGECRGDRGVDAGSGVVMIAALGRWLPGGRRAAKVAAGVVIAVAVAWFAICTAMARRSF